MTYLQSSMLFPSNPAFMASSKLENGILQAYEGSKRKGSKVADAFTL